MGNTRAGLCTGAVLELFCCSMFRTSSRVNRMGVCLRWRVRNIVGVAVRLRAFSSKYLVFSLSVEAAPALGLEAVPVAGLEGALGVAVFFEERP